MTNNEHIAGLERYLAGDATEVDDGTTQAAIDSLREQEEQRVAVFKLSAEIERLKAELEAERKRAIASDMNAVAIYDNALCKAEDQLAALREAAKRLCAWCDLLGHPNKVEMRNRVADVRTAIANTEASPCEADYKCSPGNPCRIHETPAVRETFDAIAVRELCDAADDIGPGDIDGYVNTRELRVATKRVRDSERKP
jgi:hypothetical protein